MADRRSIAVVTGSRSEYGLLRSVMRAIEKESRLELQVITCGEHARNLTGTTDEVRREFAQAISIEESDDLAALEREVEADLGRRPDLSLDISGLRDQLGLSGRCGVSMLAMSRYLASKSPEVVLVLGDRIEAFAAAAAAAIGGIRVAHMHGGDRAEGIADEAMRHAITKLAHIHLPATERSAHRIVAMGEEAHRVHIVGSPAIDELDSMSAMSDERFAALGRPVIALVLHPSGESDEREQAQAEQIISICREAGPLLVLHPNHDAGRDGIMRAIDAAEVRHVAHLPRGEFVGLMRRVEVIVGNSSAGLIEVAALGVPAVNLGPRQGGREMPGNVIDLPRWTPPSLVSAIAAARARGHAEVKHPYGDGGAGARTAELLATLDFATHGLRKRNTY